MRFLISHLSHLFVLIIALNGFFGCGAPIDVYVGPCLENCCCKVCSSQSNQAFPYGLTSQPIASNPVNPTVIGASCHVPVWSDRQYNDSNGNPVSAPSTLFWTSFAVFGDFSAKVAPMTCDCCRFSVDTSCSEVAPIAKVPSTIIHSNISTLLEKQATYIKFTDGVQLSSFDYAEIRNDTHCGYSNPRFLLRSSAGALVADSTGTSVTWEVKKLPASGCFRICYYHANLTTPGWYYVGDITIHKELSTTNTFFIDPDDVVLSGNTVSMYFYGPRLLSVFNDMAEFRVGGTCGNAGATISTLTGLSGSLDVPDDQPWCQPAVKPKITTYRPLNYIDIKYTDCPDQQRLFVARLRWVVTLPAANTYTICLRRNGTWTSTGTLVVPAQNTLANAFLALYNAAGGPGWTFQRQWPPGPVCQLHGVRCDIGGNVVGLYLGRNNLIGTIPPALFMSPLFNTLTHLKLDMNSLSGTIPREIGVLRKLRFLDLSQNQFTGTIPTTLKKAQLEAFYVSKNQFAGQVPIDFAQLSVQWTKETNIQPTPTNITIKPRCPTPVTVCSDRGSTDTGTAVCGYTGITELECLARGCCFNVQAALTFGGASCFTKKDVTAASHPKCEALACVVKYVEPQ